MKLVTIATHNERMFNIFKESAEKHGHDLVVLGFGQKWRGFTMRYELMLEYLNKIDENDIVMHADAFDSLILSGPDEIETKFKNFNKPIIFGIEMFNNTYFMNYFLSKIAFDIYQKDNILYYINGGSYIGYAKFLKPLLKALLKLSKELNITDDQILINKYISKSNNKEKYGFDFKNEFYLNTPLYYLNNDKTFVKNKKIYINGIRPALISYPGSMLINNNNQIEKLGYKNNNKTTNKTFIKYFLTRKDIFYDMILKFNKEILLIIFIFIVVKLRAKSK
jgi:hypothetical protein